MNLKILAAAACLVALPLAAQAQGIPEGAAYGFNQGNHIAGPVGAVVGGVVGGVTGGINGMLGVDPRAEDVKPQPVVYRHVRHVRHRRHHHHD